MRHRVAHRKLGRVTEHRISMLRNQATALLRHEHLTTTEPKAKAAPEGEGEAAKPKTKGVGGRLRAAAERLRGGKKSDAESQNAVESKAKHVTRKGTTGRKTGGG